MLDAMAKPRRAVPDGWVRKTQSRIRLGLLLDEVSVLSMRRNFPILLTSLPEILLDFGRERCFELRLSAAIELGRGPLHLLWIAVSQIDKEVVPRLSLWKPTSLWVRSRYQSTSTTMS